MANRADTQMARRNRLSLAIRWGRAVVLEYDVCHILLIHGCSFLLPLYPGRHGQLNGQRLRRGGVVQHSGALEAPRSLQHKDRHAGLAVLERAFLSHEVGTTCRSWFPLESATAVGVHQELAHAPLLRVWPWPGEHPRGCAVWSLAV